MITRMSLLACIAAFGHLTSAEARDVKAARQACMADYTKHCAGVTPGGGRVMKCLVDNLDKLAPECKATVNTHMNASKEKG